MIYTFYFSRHDQLSSVLPDLVGVEGARGGEVPSREANHLCLCYNLEVRTSINAVYPAIALWHVTGLSNGALSVCQMSVGLGQIISTS